MKALVLILGMLFASGAALAEPVPDCPNLELESDADSPRFDYLSADPDVQGRVKAISHNHFGAQVENLVRGMGVNSLGTEFGFVLRYIPNHHRAMNALARYSVRERRSQPKDLPLMSTECWLYRATVFRPSDDIARMIYAIYVSRVGKKDVALAQLLEVERRMPDDPNLAYNLGLIYFDKKDFERARVYARRADELGFPLKGLQQKLVKAGQWK